MTTCQLCGVVDLPNRRFKYCRSCRLNKRRAEWRAWYAANCEAQRERQKQRREKLKPTEEKRARRLAYLRAYYKRTRKVPERPCDSCGEQPRRASHARYCISCSTERRKQNADQRRAAYRARHPDRVIEQDQRTKAKNRVKLREKQKVWRARNRDRVLAKLAEWRASNRAHMRMYYRNQRMRLDYRTRQRTLSLARTHGIELHLAANEWAEICEVHAIAETLGMEVDHAVPLAGCRSCGAKGTFIADNLQPLSRNENAQKSNRCQACWERSKAADIQLLEEA